MPYGTIKVDNITFTDNSVDKTVSLSGLIQNPTFTGNVTVTTTISGDVIRGGTTISGVTVTGTTANFVSGVFTTQVSGATIIATTGTFTSLTGTTTTGTTANFVSGVFTTRVSGATITGTTVSTTTGSFVSLTGTTATFTSGIIASGTAALPSLAILSDPNTGIYSPGADQLAISTNGTGRVFVNAAGLVDISNTTSDKLTLSYPGFGIGTFGVDSSGSLLFKADEANTQAGSIIQFKIDGGEKLRIDASGNVGIGGAAANYVGYPNLRINGSSGGILELSNNGTSVFRLTADTTGAFYYTQNTSYPHVWGAGASERARIDSSGRLLVGTSSNASNAIAVVQGIAGDSTTTGVLAIRYGSTRPTGADVGIGAIRFESTSNTSSNYHYAQISCATDGASSSDTDIPGRLVFSTTADGAASPTERMRITQDGNILLATSAAGLFVGTTTDGAYRIGRNSFAVSTGTLYIGNAAIQVSSDVRLKKNIEDTNLDALDAISKIKVKDFAWDDPTDSSYNNRNARGKWTGLIAQELIEVLPFVVNAPRKEEDRSIDHDSESIWTLDQSQLCPVLIKAIQQQQEIIASLETRLSALETA
jgi:hypothetical protein